jgi:hypothetical protein
VHRVAAGLLAVGLSVGTFAASAGAAGSGMTPGERTQAKNALLVLSDLPHGWTSGANGEFSVSSQDIGANQQVARCVGVSPATIEFNPPEVQSPTFGDSSRREVVENTILVFHSASSAHQMYTAFTSPKFPACLSDTADHATTGTAPPSVSYTRTASPQGTVAYRASGSGLGAIFGDIVLSFFVHGQYGDASFVWNLGSRASVQPLALHLLGVERSRL